MARSDNNEGLNSTLHVTTRSQRPLSFVDFPYDIRYLIYREIFAGIQGNTASNVALLGRTSGTRLIHIAERPSAQSCDPKNDDLDNRSRLHHYICFLSLSETDIYERYAAPQLFKATLERLRRRYPFRSLALRHSGCDGHFDNVCEQKEGASLDLSFRKVSSEFRVEGLKIFYSTTTFSFARPHVLRRWLASIPDGLRSYVRNIHLDMEMDGEIGEVRTEAAQWANLILFCFAPKLTHVSTLHLSISLTGYITCWRRSQAAAVNGVFRPLRELRHLNVFTVVVQEQGSYLEGCKPCRQRVHLAPHDDRNYSFLLERRALARTWAEEIRDLVLRKEES